MAERIPCNTEYCSATILPSTAAKTGGICMPCYQEQERKKQQAYIEQHRKTVNLYDGLTDHVDILKVMHAPRKYDPLIQYVPYPLSMEQMYISLSDQEADCMLKYVMELFAVNNESEAEDILLSLVCYREDNISDALRELIQRGLFYNPLLFKDASQDIRDQLLERVKWDEDNRNHLLLVLGWIGDTVVIEQFREWRMQPPKWAEQLFVTPETYALDGGWELTQDGERRDLINHLCYAIRQADQQYDDLKEVHHARFLGISFSTCPWCNRKLTKLMDVATSHPALQYLNLQIENLQVITCDLCGGFSTIYMELDNHGVPVWSRYNQEPDYLPDIDDVNSSTETPPNLVLSHKPQSPYYAAVWTMSQLDSQIGGHPSWVQDSEYPFCPCCERRMRYIGQIDYADFDEYAEGIFYMFICPKDRITATVYQQS
ncbi:DUF1963 domain-containing protein [Lysinibacillus xylanilyticus]|uniref:DUF1963 domain-containing protein n=1 Tax=Lysinibacillus xylanilyticus TaxID=582475 RepID=UPI002B2493D7|nr:DUF1963 domain-containing protein [Lysinibacillus xylanilyticus]MEB2299617.1 DUF1963 domain-containing protein [Lysinibacillus xylanilyticus]